MSSLALSKITLSLPEEVLSRVLMFVMWDARILRILLKAINSLDEARRLRVLGLFNRALRDYFVGDRKSLAFVLFLRSRVVSSEPSPLLVQANDMTLVLLEVMRSPQLARWIANQALAAGLWQFIPMCLSQGSLSPLQIRHVCATAMRTGEWLHVQHWFWEQQQRDPSIRSLVCQGARKHRQWSVLCQYVEGGGVKPNEVYRILHLAAQLGNLPTVQACLNSGQMGCGDRYLACLAAAENGHWDIVMECLAHGGDWQDPWLAKICKEALAAGRRDVALKCLEFNLMHWSSLRDVSAFAIERGEWDIIDRILRNIQEAEAMRNGEGRPAEHALRSREYPDIFPHQMREFLESMLDVANAQGKILALWGFLARWLSREQYVWVLEWARDKSCEPLSLAVQSSMERHQAGNPRAVFYPPFVVVSLFWRCIIALVQFLGSRFFPIVPLLPC